MGALEDEDEDIYSQESITSYNRTMTSDVELNRTQDFGWTGHKSGKILLLWQLIIYIHYLHRFLEFRNVW